MAKWTAFPHAGDYTLDAASLKKNWARLHQGDCEPLPKEAAAPAAIFEMRIMSSSGI